MNILICGEGPNDHGTRYWDPRSKSYRDQDGWAQPLLRKLLGPRDNLTIERAERRSLVRFRRARQRRRPGHAEKAKIARNKAEREEYDILVFIVDADSTDAREWTRKNSEIESAWEGEPGVTSVACVPMSASESWLVADSDVWEAFGLTDVTKLPPSPELIWGNRNDPDGDHPHRLFARMCVEVGIPDNIETRASLASATNPIVLSNKCPISFPPFRDAIESIKNPEQP